jgi:hypothetical protein
LAETLRRLLSLTEKLFLLIEKEHQFVSIIDDSNGGVIGGAELISQAITSVSPPPSDSGKRVYSYPGIICIPLESTAGDLVAEVNALRSEFKAMYSILNKTSPHIKRVGNSLSLLISEQFGRFPLLSTNAQSLSIGHLTRHFMFAREIHGVNIYKDPLRKRQKVSIAELYASFDLLSDDRADILTKKLAGYDECDLRYSFDSEQYRYRINIHHPNGVWTNKAISTPLIIAGPKPEISFMAKKNLTKGQRKGADSLIPVIEELNIYAIKH